jgi:hypothetical protein
MNLSQAQLQTLKTDLAASSPGVADDVAAAAYNLAASPDFWVWRSRVSKDEFVNSTSIDGTVFSWTGTGFITRSAGEQAAWRELFDAQGYVNPSLPQVRTAFTDIFSGGTAPAPANRTHLATVGRRKATRAEKLFATGTGSTASPAVMGAEGILTDANVYAARQLP